MAGEVTSPLVSVVMLTWNRRPMLEGALASVLGQTMGDLEVLVIDNESDDDTGSFVRGVPDGRVRYHRNANGGNLSVNRNFGVAHARGRWIAFCDDDDVWEPAKLEKQLALAGSMPDVAVVCSEAVLFTGEPGSSGERRHGTLYGAKMDEDVTLEDLLAGRNEVALSSSLVRREVMAQVGEWDEDQAIFAVEDYQYWVRVSAAGHRIHRLAEPLLRYRQHAAMVSSADSRVALRKQRRALAGLAARGVLTSRQASDGDRALRRAIRWATLKEAAKRVPGLRAALYAWRGWTHRRGEKR